MRQPSLDSSILDKVAWAEACSREQGERLLRDDEIRRLLDELARAAERSRGNGPAEADAVR